jgi:hypothetical protein
MKHAVKITPDNLCGGEFVRQVEEALADVAQNIAQVGGSARHEITIKVTFNENREMGGWEADCKTTVTCNFGKRMIGSKAPVKIVDKILYDANPQAQLLFAK